MFEETILNVSVNGQGVLSRRCFIKGIGLGAAGLAGVSFTDLMASQAEELRKRQMACILLWMGGGPSQMDTFDPKPDHANGGSIKAIETAVPGIRIAEGWEQTAKAMKDIALIRSMTNKEGNHQRAAYQVHTGYAPTGTLKHPNIGGLAAAELGDPKFDLPHMVAVNGPTFGAGFLGVGLEPFVVTNPEQPPANATLPASVGAHRFQRRLGLMHALENSGFERTGGADRVKDHAALYKQTAGLVLSPRMKAFHVQDEPAAVRAAYGQTQFGQGCLLARRLVEAGVTFVEVRSAGQGGVGGWDTHQNNHERVKANAGLVDPAFATLINDLKANGMLDRTLVLWMGEFGRTPKINPNAGRDHFPRVFNAAIAGGGVKGGQVVGESTPDGTAVKDNPVAVNDLLASVCHALKIDSHKENMTPVGRPIKIVDGGNVVKELFA